MTTSRIFRSGFELALLALCACSPVETTPDDAGTFVALAPDFADYESWASYPLGDGGAPADDAGCVHVADVPRVVYLNQAPPHGSTEFPVGTILVKEIHTGASPADWQVLAMVKRGGGYDPGSGCVGWEWFGLDVSGASPAIQWRGIAPPASESYAGCGPCSSCHSASTNDCVQAPELSLSQW